MKSIVHVPANKLTVSDRKFQSSRRELSNEHVADEPTLVILAL